MDYKTQVETILSQRKEFLEEIKKDEQIVNEMSSSFQMIKSDLLSINSNGIDKILPVIDESLSKLEQASDKIYRMKKRFSRETVNIGVAVTIGGLSNSSLFAKSAVSSCEERQVML